MSATKINQNRFIFSSSFSENIKSNPIILADVGARGDLSPPWVGLDENTIFTVGFEPDKKECNRLNSLKIKNRLYVPNALWSSKDTLKFHLANEPSTSSIHPPNLEFIQKYKDNHWKPRITKNVVSVNCTTLDEVLNNKNLDCDFLKIDTHGAEFDILQGASASLKTKIFGVLIETWTSEVHQGQHLTGDILSFMTEMGFSLFDVNVAAAWKRQIAYDLNLSGKPQIIGLDLLFFKNKEALISQENQVSKIIKAAAIAEVYGFPDYSIELLNAETESNLSQTEMITSVRKMIIQNSQTRFNFIRKLKRILYTLLGIGSGEYPSLH